MSALLTDEGTQVTHEGTRIRMTVAEMNCATRRVVELQAPWSVDRQWHSGPR
jgi:hypothetical protein